MFFRLWKRHLSNLSINRCTKPLNYWLDWRLSVSTLNFYKLIGEQIWAKLVYWTVSCVIYYMYNRVELSIPTTNLLYRARSDGNGWWAKHEIWVPTNHRGQNEEKKLALASSLLHGSGKETSERMRLQSQQGNSLLHITTWWQCSLHHVAVCSP